MSLEKIVALVPMRHDSVRVIGKNYRHICGKPLYAHIIESLLAVPEVDTILVDTDSAVILEGLERDYPQVKRLLRPEHMRADTLPMNEILIYDTGQIEADLYFQTHSTNPLLKPETISKAIRKLRACWPEYDSLFGVTRLQTRLWDANAQAVNHDPNVLLRTQDLPPIYEENSCIYLFTRDNLLARSNRIGYNPMMFEIDAEEAWDIDEEIDFSVAEALLSYRLRQSED
jgi:CMP-N-acetylneuraminic acid synthetase